MYPAFGVAPRESILLILCQWYINYLTLTTLSQQLTLPPSLSCVLWPILLRVTTPNRTSTLLPILPSVRSYTPQLSVSHRPCIDIRDARDAHIILEAVRLGVLPLITRRLSSTEREQLSSGHVFVWEEAEFKGGLERWTDGRRW